jgi:hypothetical protein
MLDPSLWTVCGPCHWWWCSRIMMAARPQRRRRRKGGRRGGKSPGAGAATADDQGLPTLLPPLSEEEQATSRVAAVQLVREALALGHSMRPKDGTRTPPGGAAGVLADVAVLLDRAAEIPGSGCRFCLPGPGGAEFRGPFTEGELSSLFGVAESAMHRTYDDCAPPHEGSQKGDGTGVVPPLPMQHRLAAARAIVRSAPAVGFSQRQCDKLGRGSARLGCFSRTLAAAALTRSQLLQLRPPTAGCAAGGEGVAGPEALQRIGAQMFQLFNDLAPRSGAGSGETERAPGSEAAARAMAARVQRAIAGRGGGGVGGGGRGGRDGRVFVFGSAFSGFGSAKSGASLPGSLHVASDC